MNRPEKTEGSIENGQSKDNFNMKHTRVRPKTNKKNNTENRIDKQHGPHQKSGVDKGARNGIQFLLLI